MNILLFCNNFPLSYDDAFVSGLVKNAFNHALALRRNGHNVTVITDAPVRGTWDIEGINVHSVGGGFLKGVFKAAFLDVLMTTRFLGLGNRSFDIVHIHSGNLVCFFLLKKFGFVRVPVIYTAHGTTTPELEANMHHHRSFKEWLVHMNGTVQEWIDRFMWKHADMLISVSRFQVAEMRSIYGVPKSKIACVYNGVDRTRYALDIAKGVQCRATLAIPEDAPVVLFVGRLAQKKGVHLLLDALPEVVAHCPKARFVFVFGEMGRKFDAAYGASIRERIAHSPHKEHIVVSENVSEVDLPSYYNMATVCVFPSLQYESLPTVVYEAMAAGKPIITQGSWGTPEVLGEVLLTEAQLHDDTLSSSIIELLNDPARRAMLGEQNHVRSADFTWEAIGAQYTALYETLIQKAKA